MLTSLWMAAVILVHAGIVSLGKCQVTTGIAVIVIGLLVAPA